MGITMSDMDDLIKKLNAIPNPPNIYWASGIWLKAMRKLFNTDDEFLTFLNCYDEVVTNTEGIEFINKLKENNGTSNIKK